MSEITWHKGDLDADRRENWSARLDDGRSFVATLHLAEGSHGVRWRLQGYSPAGTKTVCGWYVSMESCEQAVEGMERDGGG